MRRPQAAAAAVPPAARKHGRSSDEDGGEHAPACKRAKHANASPPSKDCPQVQH